MAFENVNHTSEVGLYLASWYELEDLVHFTHRLVPEIRKRLQISDYL